jgi:hypothetical protein
MTVSILVVDDEPDVADLFRQRFRREARDGTYVMHFASSGEQALERLDGKIEPALTRRNFRGTAALGRPARGPVRAARLPAARRVRSVRGRFVTSGRR